MTLNRRFEFINDKKITAQIADSINNFLWVAFAQNIDGNCIIEKEAKFNPIQTYFSLDRAVSEINAMALDSSNLYVAYNDSSLLGEIISKSTPLTVTTEISRGAIVEYPVDVLINGTDLWYLLPGIISGTNAQLLRYNTSGILQETIDLQKSGSIVNNAKTMTIDSIGDIWIGTFETPARVVRVYEMSGGIWDFDIDETLIP